MLHSHPVYNISTSSTWLLTLGIIFFFNFSFVLVFYFYLFKKNGLSSPEENFSLLLEGVEGVRGRKENINVRKKHWLLASHLCSNRGSNPQPRYASWPGIKPATSGVGDDTPTNWATLASAIFYLCYFSNRHLSSLCPFPPPCTPVHHYQGNHHTAVCVYDAVLSLSHFLFIYLFIYQSLPH